MTGNQSNQWLSPRAIGPKLFVFELAILFSSPAQLSLPMKLWQHPAFGMTILTVTLLASALAEEVRNDARIVVLKSGKVIEGQVRPVTGGYAVERGGSTISLPDEQVACVASSMAEAYQQIRDQRKKPGERNPTVEDHQQLAEWCLSQNLYREARDEVRLALKLDPERTALRRLLMRIEEVLDPAPVAVQPALPRTDALGYQARNVESLGGLTTATATEFSLKVHPILMNKCGLGSCHGNSSKSEFRLSTTRVSGGSHRLYAERNLAAVASLINLSEPEQSQLLLMTRQMHGGMNQPPLQGSAGRQQMETLERWVHRYAVERNPKLSEMNAYAQSGLNRPQTSESMESTGQMQVKSGVIEEGGLLPPVRQTPPDEVQPSHPGRDADAARSSVSVEEVAPRRLRPDAFDPDAFNRRYHGREVLRDRALRDRQSSQAAGQATESAPPSATNNESSASKGQP